MTPPLRTLGHLVRADFLERVRRHGFLVTLGVTLYFAWAFLPPMGSKVVTLQIADHRGIYNSAWVGCTVAVLASVFLGMAGFYLVKNAIERDRTTGVGQILATTPVTKPLYTLGKAGSNFAVLATLAALLAIGAMAMQLLRGEDRHLDPLAVLVPFALVTLPVLAIAGATAVLFEAVPWLRGGLGNAAYVFLFTSSIAMSDLIAGRGSGPLGDFLGASAVVPAMIRGVAHAFPGVDPVRPPMNIGFSFRDRPFSLETFTWSGPEWTAEIVLGRIAWSLLAVGIALVAAIPFDRFDTVARPRRAAGAKSGEGAELLTAPAMPTMHAGDVASTIGARTWSLAPLIVAELRLMVRGMPRAWWLVAAGLALACWLAPLAVARQWLLPFAWIWPLLVWSPLGAREALHRTEGLVFSSPRPLARTLAAGGIAGALVALALGAGVGMRLALGDQLDAALAWLVGACFIPSLALACGAWTGNGRMFEVLYLLLWYIGPMNRLPFIDYIGTTPEAIAAGSPARFAIATALLIVFAALARTRRLRR